MLEPFGEGKGRTSGLDWHVHSKPMGKAQSVAIYSTRVTSEARYLSIAAVLRGFSSV